MIQTENQLLLLGGDTPSTWIIYNELVQRLGVFPALIEQPMSRRKLLMNRAKKIGVMAVASQIAFLVLVRPVIRLRSKRRIEVLRRLHGLETVMPVSDYIHHVDSVNEVQALGLIEACKPKIVIVNGTRILSRRTLAKIGGTVINTHQGITPTYRGAHGAYWALYNKDRAHCGVTIHIVDEGIDTGNIVAQVLVSPEPEDNFATYPFLLSAAAVEPLVQAVEATVAGTLETKPISGQSTVWYHPGIFQYLRGAWRGVR